MLTPPPTHPQLLAGRGDPILDPDLPIVDSHIHHVSTGIAGDFCHFATRLTRDTA